MGWSPSVRLVWGWEAEKETFDKPTGKIKYNENTGEPYDVLVHSHECFMVDDVNVFEDDHVHVEDNLLGLSDYFSLGSFSNRSENIIWGIPITKNLYLEDGVFEQLDAECPEEIINYARDNGFEPPKLWIVGG